MKNYSFRAIQCILLFSILISCELNQENNPIDESYDLPYCTTDCGEVVDENNIPIIVHFIFDEVSAYRSEIDLGLWMIDNNKIAHWSTILGPSKNPMIYEPINVIWLDFSASTIDEAKTNVNLFLRASDMHLRSWSSHGYNSIIGRNLDDLTCLFQWPSSDPCTWADGDWNQDNNHGRTFSAFETQISSGETVFYTLGSFSREQGVSHDFISFDTARDHLKPDLGWQEGIKRRYDKQIFNSKIGTDGSEISTKDHDGIRVFYKLPNERLNISGTYVGKGNITNSGCTDDDINQTFEVDMVLTLIHNDEDGSLSGTLQNTWHYLGMEFTGQDDIIDGTVLLSDRSFNLSIEGNAGNTSSRGTITGQIQGTSLTINYNSKDYSGETCSTSGSNIGLKLINE